MPVRDIPTKLSIVLLQSKPVEIFGRKTDTSKIYDDFTVFNAKTPLYKKVQVEIIIYVGLRFK